MRGIISEGPHPPTLRPHRLAYLLDLAQASLEDLVVAVVDDVVQVLILRSNDTRELTVELCSRKAVVRHDRHPLAAVKGAYYTTTTARRSHGGLIEGASPGLRS